MGNLPLPSLSEAERDAIDAQIMPLVIEAVIFAFPPHNTPGLDGFPADFYQSYVETLAPRLSTLFAHCLDHQTLLLSMLEAYMILPPKPNKDSTECSSYSPIALLNMDPIDKDNSLFS